MSELINIRADRANIRWKLLTSVSAAALLVSVSGIGQAQADDNDGDRPLIWVELGGQLEQLSDSQGHYCLLSWPPSASLISSKR